MTSETQFSRISSRCLSENDLTIHEQAIPSEFSFSSAVSRHSELIILKHRNRW